MSSKSVPIERANWTVASQRNGGQYDTRATEYEGICCKCLDCTQSFVFTPDAQKHAFEVEKRFVWYVPKHCPECASHESASNAQSNRALNLTTAS